MTLSCVRYTVDGQHKTISEDFDINSAKRSRASQQVGRCMVCLWHCVGELTIKIELFVHAAFL